MTVGGEAAGSVSPSGAPTCDVLVVGAGPAGTATAAHLGQLGVRDVTIVDRDDFPRDKTCGSGISPRGLGVLRDLGVWESVEAEAYWIRGLRLVTPEGHESFQSAGEAASAIICQRRSFDHILLRRATSLGATFVPGFTADRLITEDGGDGHPRVVGAVAKDGRAIRARYTVVAGGTHCRLVDRARPRRIIQAIMGWWEGVVFRPHFLELIFDRMIAPYYGWLFPESEHKVNIGITYEDRPGATRNARQLFQQFLDKHYRGRLEPARQVGGWKGHPIAYSYRIEKLASPGCFVVGESGLLTHPATGEGIYQGMKSGMLAAEALADTLAGRADEPRAMAEYEERCKKAFFLSFLGGGIFRSFVRTPLFDWATRMTEKPIVQNAAAKLIAAL